MGMEIGYCHGGFHEAFVFSLAMLAKDPRVTGVRSHKSLYIDNNRNLLAAKFLDGGEEWLLSMDTDIGVPLDLQPTIISRMLEATRGGARKIVAAPYWVQHDDGNYCVWMRHERDGLQPYFSIPRSGIIKLGACGMGFTLIHRQVFLDIADLPHDPRDPWIWYGRDILDVGGKIGRAGEDVSFCIRAREAGHDTWGVCDLVVEHHKTHAVGEPVPMSPIVGMQHKRPSGLLIPA
jgi:hypothetical protein